MNAGGRLFAPRHVLFLARRRHFVMVYGAIVHG
jgi:hypothetical protein